jgi:sugar lactone lactonase YvrE
VTPEAHPTCSVFSAERLALGEAPLSHHLRNSLVWCDIAGRAVYEQSLSGGASRRFPLPVMPSAAGIIDTTRILLATHVDLRVLDLENGAMQTLIRMPEDRGMRTNDGRTHPSGAFWIGTMARDGTDRPGAIFRWFDGELTRMIDGVVTPNAICFAADGSFAYYADSPKRTIWRIATDPRSGATVGPAEVFTKLRDDMPGIPDGAVVDAEGNLWNARWRGGAVDVYDTEGRHIHCYRVPVQQPTCPAFVGADLSRLVVTSATVTIAPDALGELDGMVLELDVPVVGRAEAFVRI